MQVKIIPPHKNVSRLVKPEEAMLVFKESEKIFPLLDTPIGRYRNFFAIAHPQIEAERPLRFFVVNPNAMEFLGYRSIVIVNPVIERHTNSEVDSEEGCATFSKLPPAKVRRWNKCDVAFSPLIFDENKVPMLGARIHLKLNGKVAKIFQHEVDHLDAKYIY